MAETADGASEEGRGDLRAELRAELEQLEARSRRRQLPEPGSGAVDFSSNDYLGLARHPELASAGERALRESGSGGRASRLLSGGSAEHVALERLGAEWLGAEAALFFPSGYQANLGLVGALAGRGDVLFSDELNHASLIDAARLSRARIDVFPHTDLARLEELLERAPSARRRLVLTESVFSMDGDLAPLLELHELCERHDAWLVVDEAHAAGLLGPEGAGACAAVDRPLPRLAARVVTGGKALGATGALVAGSRELCDVLVNRARSFVFTTAPSPAAAAVFAKGIELVRGMDAERERTLAVTRDLAEELDLPAPAAAILPFPAADEAHALELATKLAAEGLDVRAIRPPTVPEESSRLRIVCHATNTDAELDELARHLRPHRRSAPAPAPALAPVLFVTGTDTDIGKTVVSALLVRAAKRRGPARYWKPVQTGMDSDTEAVSELADVPPPLRLPPAFHFPEPASPHTAAKFAGREIPVGALELSLAGIRRMLESERVVAELAGGLLVPLRDGWTQLDWLEREAPPLVLVARSALGTLNHTLLSLEALRRRHLEPRALFLVGDPHPENLRTLRAMGGVPDLYELPRLEPLDAAALDRWLDQNPLDHLFA